MIDQFKVPVQWVDEFIRILITNGRFAQLVQDISGSPYFVMGKYQIEPEEESEDLEGEEEVEEEEPPKPPLIPTEPEKKLIFIAHGKNKHPLEQLKNLLNRFKIEHKVAVDEPHAGRPITQKVSEIMHECSSAILIFTGDEEYTSSDGNTIIKPSDNVVYELGAATVLYGNRIVIFKEEGVTFASNFQDFGYITFEKDRLDAKSMELLMELVELGFLQITPT